MDTYTIHETRTDGKLDFLKIRLHKPGGEVQEMSFPAAMEDFARRIFGLLTDDRDRFADMANYFPDAKSWSEVYCAIEFMQDAVNTAIVDREHFEQAMNTARADERCAMGYLSEVRATVGGDDFPDMVKRVAGLKQERDALLAKGR